MNSEGQTMRASWNGATIAESDETIVVEGNHYFPRASVRPDAVEPSATTTTCPWKGEARYLSVRVGGEVNEDAAWFCPQPTEAAQQIAGRVAFWRGVRVDPVEQVRA